MKVLVTGAAGMLGQELVRVLGSDHEVVATDVDTLDIRDAPAVNASIRDLDFVFHLAAMTDVDRCELEPDAAYLANTIGTENIALACRRAHIPMLYVSTVSVFDGRKDGPYTEYDQPNPTSHYSRSKYQGELIVQQLVQEHYIVRAGWMFGGGPLDKKFVAKIIERARQQAELPVVDDKFGSPTYTVDFSRSLAAIAASGRFGTYHSVNAGEPCSRFEFAREILRVAGITTCTPVPVSSDKFPLPAPRPRMEAARNLHLELIGVEAMRPWKEAIADYIHTTLLPTA